MTKAASFDYSQAVSPWHSSHDGVGNVLRTAENHTMSGMTDRVVVNTYDHCNRLDTEQCDQIGSILDGGEAGARRESHAMPRMANQTITPSGGSAVTTGYGYDLADNRTSKSDGSAVTEYNFGNGNNGANSNQLISYGPAGQTVTHTFSYDNNGNRETRVTSAGTETYTWDDDNRLTALDTPSGDYSYKYDHRARRIVRDESAASGVVTELTFSGGTSVQESNISGTVQVELIRGSDWGGGVGGVLFTIRSGQRSYNAYNSRGDVVSVTNDSGAATWQASYEAFGTRTEEDGTNTERQRANTKEEDPTGLLNEGFRYRDLEAGVFISRDPLGFVDGPNVYAYVRQNPWSKFDPEGLFEWSKVGTSLLNSLNEAGELTIVSVAAIGEIAALGTLGTEANAMFTEKATGIAKGLVDSGGRAIESAHLAAGGHLSDATQKTLTILGDTPEEAVANGGLMIVTGGANRYIRGKGTTPSSSSKEVSITQSKVELTPAQAKKLQQFDKKTPANATPAKVDRLDDGNVLFTAESAGKNPSSKKVYQKSVTPEGETTSYTKTTVTPDSDQKKVTDALEVPEKVIHQE